MSPHSRHTPPFQPCICSIHHLYPDTHVLLRSVDGDTRISASVVPYTRAVGPLQLPTPLKRGAGESVCTFLLKGAKFNLGATSRMFGFLKSPTFNYVFSFILGLGLMALLKPACKGEECKILKAPPLEDVKKTTYQLGSACYQFHTEPITCPSKGVIEPFQRSMTR